VTIFFVSNYYLIRLTTQLNNYSSSLNKMNTKQIIIMNVIRKNMILGTSGKKFEYDKYKKIRHSNINKELKYLILKDLNIITYITILYFFFTN